MSKRTALQLDVSRETSEKLETYLALLKKWNKKINLVSPDTIASAWDRHIIDSAQVASIPATSPAHWVDLGSGGGFPGLVVATIYAEKNLQTRFTLVESDQRKCAFLRTVKRELGLNAEIISERIESVTPLMADVLSARALASLTTLLGFASQHMQPAGTAIFPKGQSWKKELVEAQNHWIFQSQTHKSVTDPDAVILELKDIAHA